MNRCFLKVVFIFSYLVNVPSKGYGSDQSMVGVETDFFSLFSLGSYNPGGTINIGLARYYENLLIRNQIGIDYNLDYHYSLGFEGYNLIRLSQTESVGPIFGLSGVYANSFQRMTDKSREDSTNKEHWDIYLVADYALALFGFAGLRLYSLSNQANHFSLSLGWNKRIKFVTKNLKEKEIRNCYVDDCSDSHSSGGGSWPPPEQSLFLAASWEFMSI